MADFKFNPKVKDFLENKKDIKMLGFFWALYWRWVLVIWGVCIAAIIVIVMIAIVMKLVF